MNKAYNSESIAKKKNANSERSTKQIDVKSLKTKTYKKNYSIKTY